MAQGLAFPPKEPVTTVPQLGDMGIGEAIQGARHGGLGGELWSSPRAGQGQVRSQPGVDLGNGPTAGQDTDQNVEHVGGWGMGHGFERYLDRLQYGSQKAGAHEAIPQHPQGGEVGLFGHRDQTNRGLATITALRRHRT
jgi:hypothetical protein